MMLNGQDLDESVSPLEVPYGWIVDAHKEFIGKTALMARKILASAASSLAIEMTAVE